MNEAEQIEYEQLLDKLASGSLDGKTLSPDEQVLEILKLGIKFGECRLQKRIEELERGVRQAFDYGLEFGRDCAITASLTPTDESTERRFQNFLKLYRKDNG